MATDNSVIREFLQAGDAALAATEYNEAGLKYCAALDLSPRLPKAHYNLGAMLLLAKRPLDALPALMTAAQLAPNNAQFVVAFSRAMIEIGEAERASSYLHNATGALKNDPLIRKSIAQLPVPPGKSGQYVGFATPTTAKAGEAAQTRVLNAYRSGDFQTAWDKGWKLIWKAPNSIVLWKILSGAARHVGTRENAEMCARRVLALKPDDPEAWSNLSRIVRDAHRRSDAERLLRSGLEHTDYAPRLAQPLFEVLDEDNRFEEALDAINEIIGKQKEPSAILFRVKGEIHERLDDLDNARLAYEEASRLAPMDGETTAAVAAFLDKLVDPEPLLAHLRAARERGVTFDRGDLLDGEARALLRAGELDNARRSIQLAITKPGELSQMRSRYFTLGRIEDKAKNYRAAFDAFLKGNEFLEKYAEGQRKFDHTVTTKRVDYLIETLEEEINQNQDRVGDRNAGPKNIAFIVGFPRSGTTLLDTILRSHSKVEVIEEKGILNSAITDTIGPLRPDDAYNPQRWISLAEASEMKTLRDNYLKHMARYAGEELADDKIYIDKLPLNMNWAPLLHRMLPQSLFILAIRHPLDVAISNLFQDFRPNNAMMNMTRIERIDALYEKSFKLFEMFSDYRKPNLERVSYEDVVNNLEETVGRVMNRLGLEWEESQSRYFETALKRGKINTPSYTQVSQKLYTSSTERWRNYAFALEENTDNLKRWALKHGYTV